MLIFSMLCFGTFMVTYNYKFDIHEANIYCSVDECGILHGQSTELSIHRFPE